MTHRKLVSISQQFVPCSLALPSSSSLGRCLGVTGAAKMPLLQPLLLYLSALWWDEALQLGCEHFTHCLQQSWDFQCLSCPVWWKGFDYSVIVSSIDIFYSDFSYPFSYPVCPFVFQTCYPVLLCLLLLCFSLHPPKSQRPLTICPFCPLTQCKGSCGQYR